MARRSLRVRDLAAEAGLELDDTLVMLWEAGVDYVREPYDLISKQDVNRARRGVGLPTQRDLQAPGYWQDLLSLEADELVTLLASLRINLAPEARKLPKGAVKKLQVEARRMRVEPRAPTPPKEPDTQHKIPTFEWTCIGRERDCQYLTFEQVMGIHDALVADFQDRDDPIVPAGVRDAGLLESALYRPRTAIGPHRKYPTVEMAAAALLHSLVHNHPFHNGNKRTGLVAMLVFLDKNGCLLTCDEDELFQFVLRTAQHGLVPDVADHYDDREVQAIADWVRCNSRGIEKGEKVLKWYQLKRILHAFDCRFAVPGGVGNRINIERTVQRHRRLIPPKKETLFTQTHYAGDGRDVEKNSVNRIRHDLELDDAHGVDSKMFYAADADAIDEFIARYRKTLNRLSRL